LIAIAGLAMGITSALLLYAYIDYHRSFENFLPENSHIKRLVCHTVDKYGVNRSEGMYSINYYASELLRTGTPLIEEMTRLNMEDEVRFAVNGEVFSEWGGFVDSNFFQLIPFPVLEGNREDFFSRPRSVVLNKEMAEKFFPGSDALGKTIKLIDGEGTLLTVSGVVHIPRNSHLRIGQFQAFLPLDVLERTFEHEVFSSDSIFRMSVYFSTSSAENGKRELSSSISQLSKEIPYQDDLSYFNLTYENFEDIHLFSSDSTTALVNPLYLILFLSLLTALLLIIAIINSVSILTAQSVTRTREVGIRLVLGSRRKDLILQFLTEAVTLAFLSFFAALIMTELLMPSFSNLVGIDLTVSYSPVFILYSLLLTVSVGLLAGAYPAFFLSSLDPVESLKGRKLLRLGVWKKALLVGQFLFTSIVLLWSLVFNNEIRFIGDLDPGFDQENLVSIYPGWNLDREPVDTLMQLKSELEKLDGVDKVSYTSYAPYLGGIAKENLFIEEEGGINHHEVFTYIDSDYLNVLGVKVLDGDPEVQGVAIMKSANQYRKLQIGDPIKLDTGQYTLSAIIDDYYLDAPYGETPRFHVITDRLFNFQVIKYNALMDMKEVRNLWQRFFPDRIFEYFYMSDQIERQTKPPEIHTMIKVMNLTMAVTLFLSAIGLFGLILQTLRQKTREIGIRKALGARFLIVVSQILKDVFLLIAFGVVTGILLGALSIGPLLRAFGYIYPVHNLVPLSLLSSLIIGFTGLLFIGSIVYRAVNANPVDALRYE
jgi:putative ABC transport system permease protein